MDMRLEDEGIFEKSGQGPPLGPNDPRRLAVRAGCYVTPELIASQNILLAVLPQWPSCAATEFLQDC